MKKLITSLMVSLFFVLTASAQKQITVDDFTTKPTFYQKTVTGINWMNDGKFYSALADNKVIKYDITSGQAVETLVDGTTLNPKIEIEDYSLSADEKKIVILTDSKPIYRRSYTGEYYVYDLTNKTVKKLSSTGRQSYATLSPDGAKVAFVRDNNLFYVDLASMKESQVTDDGKFNAIINGSTDWVYEEEFGFVTGFYWSPDSKKLAYYRFDESAVKEYNLQRWNKGQLYPEDYKFKYPKAGETNSTVEIWITDITTNAKVKADLGTDKDFYIPRVKWTNDPNTLSIRKLNRLQNQLDLIHTNANTGKSSIVLTEREDAYVDLEFIDDLTYLKDGKHFIHSSERDGYKHLYLYSMAGGLVKQVTKGAFEVYEFLGYDEKAKLFYYSSTEVSPLERHLYSISFDGKKKQRLTKNQGSHAINMSKDFQFYIDHHTSASQPSVATLYRSKGNTLVKVLEKNESLTSAIKEYGLSPKSFYTVKASDGSVLNGLMLKPANFDSTKQYPVLIYQYSGPNSQNVTNSWGGSHFYFHQMLTQKGYIVAIVDSRGTGARGEAFKKVTYKQNGKYELEDIITTAKYLGSLSYIDESRMGVWGWSYGGYMSSLAMTKGGGVFKMGIAVAPVTNWRFYDSIYTERYLQTPQLNADGYDQNSPLTFAGDLQGKFLLIHGTADDNVHFQNSVVFQEALINAGKQFDSFYYPDKNHSIPGGKTRHHLYTKMIEYVMANL
ncbi:S9 family peptidase [Chryseosolibacter indicus]|uniref:DPP IV N-terminal domain-containing protein n=1 Tax=Chryseosolibacter indicus TaxID=2782351 RepID=A0ABS5VST7_9BACT|nr:S9 family peptidase [Chryseosolibacter indicus]MBT1703066.1 DPP IV N-terminal domain-containing protein [Chryseosolibacter indicus]